ncbi:hypothetical protein B0J13DRAFT_550170 [Dactylonectria estremocensis]|uniref:Uncharacterized protein n=1 Tax=Dactylonectria estremocensis TaxID=1079267 RepID=A0A9P9F2L9_9HYPO|nr:hypothetical protein B0J13DRAFT_550170 [Dactylonectria estremocensis]
MPLTPAELDFLRENPLPPPPDRWGVVCCCSAAFGNGIGFEPKEAIWRRILNKTMGDGLRSVYYETYPEEWRCNFDKNGLITLSNLGYRASPENSGHTDQYTDVTRQTEGVMLVYDVMSRESFNSFPRIYQTIFRSAADNARIFAYLERPAPAKEPTGIMQYISRFLCPMFLLREPASTAATPRWQRRRKRTSRWKSWKQAVKGSSNRRGSEEVQKPAVVSAPPKPPKPTLEQIRAKAEALGIQPGVFPFVVLGREMAVDPEHQWQVSREEGEAFAREIGADFHLIRTDENNPQSYDVTDDLIPRIMLRRVFGLGPGSITK